MIPGYLPTLEGVTRSSFGSFRGFFCLRNSLNLFTKLRTRASYIETEYASKKGGFALVSQSSLLHVVIVVQKCNKTIVKHLHADAMVVVQACGRIHDVCVHPDTQSTCQ